MNNVYFPPGPIIKAFINDDSFVRGIMGPIGSGKSTSCAMELMARAGEQAPFEGIRKTRWAIVRNSYPELKTTTIKTWHQWVPESLGRWIAEGPPTHRITNDELDIEVIFVALDRPQDVRKLLSMELTGAWINEAREIPKAVLDGLTGRVGRYPPVREGGCTWSGIIMDTNPPDTDHWWYHLAEETKPNGFRFFRQPGGLTPNAENLENLPVDYYKRAMAGKKEEWINVYINGEYGFVLDGKPVYSEYVDSLHCKDFDLLPELPIHIGIDFGLTPAATLGQRTAMGQWRIHSELVTQDMGAVRFAELLKNHIAMNYPNHKIGSITGDPAGDIRAQTDETTPFQILNANGIEAIPANTNDFIIRREAVAKPLSRLIDGQPGMIVHATNCRVLRKAMSGAYCLRRIQTAEEKYRDMPDKNAYSHVAESLQYMMLGAGEGDVIITSKNWGKKIEYGKAGVI